jgi:hypothetical protein
MSREKDLEWFLENRKHLAERYQCAWLVVFGKKVVATFLLEEEAIQYSVSEYGINRASVFRAVAEDPFVFA